MIHNATVRNVFEKREPNIKRHGRQSKKFNKYLNYNTRKKYQRKLGKVNIS